MNSHISILPTHLAKRIGILMIFNIEGSTKKQHFKVFVSGERHQRDQPYHNFKCASISAIASLLTYLTKTHLHPEHSKGASGSLVIMKTRNNPNVHESAASKHYDRNV